MSLSSSVPETLVQCHRLVAATAGTGRWSVSPRHSGRRRWVPDCVGVWWAPGHSGTNTHDTINWSPYTLRMAAAGATSKSAITFVGWNRDSMVLIFRSTASYNPVVFVVMRAKHAGNAYSAWGTKMVKSWWYNEGTTRNVASTYTTCAGRRRLSRSSLANTSAEAPSSVVTSPR